jgi:hypothetical protein
MWAIIQYKQQKAYPIIKDGSIKIFRNLIMAEKESANLNDKGMETEIVNLKCKGQDMVDIVEGTS